jgi:hypothetical protein
LTDAIAGWPTPDFLAGLADDPLYAALDIVEGAAVPDFVRQRLAESAGLAAFSHPDF